MVREAAKARTESQGVPNKLDQTAKVQSLLRMGANANGGALSQEVCSKKNEIVLYMTEEKFS